MSVSEISNLIKNTKECNSWPSILIHIIPYSLSLGSLIHISKPLVLMRWSVLSEVLEDLSQRVAWHLVSYFTEIIHGRNNAIISPGFSSVESWRIISHSFKNNSIGEESLALNSENECSYVIIFLRPTVKPHLFEVVINDSHCIFQCFQCNIELFSIICLHCSICTLNIGHESVWKGIHDDMS